MLGSFCTITAYDIGCIYPRELGDDLFRIDRDAAGFFTGRATYHKFETPIIARLTQHLTTCQAMCLSFHDEHILDPNTMQPTTPIFQVPTFGQNPYSATMCYLQCDLYVAEGVFDIQERIHERYNNIGVNLTYPSERKDIQAALRIFDSTGNTRQIEDILLSDDYHPYTMGHIAGNIIQKFMAVDGWNAEGDRKWNSEAGSAVPCTSSCRKYQSTIKYTPAFNPRNHPRYNDKYKCNGLCRKWQPLQEGDDAGNMKRQEFIVPHIGQKASTFLREPTLTLEDPEYDLYEESLLVVERLRNTTYDQYKKDAIKVMDNKLFVRATIESALKDQFKDIHSFQDHVLYLFGSSMVENDSIIQAWKEKVKHDLVRPTTVIKHWGTDELFTFGGDPSVSHPVNIIASDFEAFVRVMPHGEFPSGSSCLCTGYYEYTDTFTSEMYNMNVTNLTLSDRYVLSNLEELRDVCAESRLWAGLHFPASVTAGIEICRGIGQLGFNYVNLMKNNATYVNGGGPWYLGDTLPTCPE